VRGRGLLRWVCVATALVLSVIWLLAAAGGGFSAPVWVPPGSVVALAVAVALP
jgi:hypothetical protein